MTRRLIAGLTGMALAAFVATSALAYVGDVPQTVTLSAPATATSGKPFTISALVMGQSALAPAGQVPDVALVGITVEWTATQPAGGHATVVPPSSDTDGTGHATTTATIVCDDCSVRFRATADTEFGEVVVKVTAAGLPNTAATTSGISGSFAATILAVFAVIAGVLLMVRQIVVARR